MTFQLLSHLLLSLFSYLMTASQESIYAQRKREFLFTFPDNSVFIRLKSHWA